VAPGVERLAFPDDSEGIPNNAALPVIVHHGVEAIVDDPAACEELFAGNGWGGSWRDGIFSYHHFHSNAHEALGIVSGRARVTLGGPGGETFDVAAGDVLVLPAGTGHKREDAGGGLLVVGAYPRGQENYDLRRADPDVLAEVRANIARVKLPDGDPVGGGDGPLVELWQASDPKG
jgi:uncharacterized protein YjlB